MNNNIRYSRQIVLPEIGPTGQEKIARARILVVGAGGLGCPVLLYLAAAGIGTLGVIDHDHVDESNLQRQILFTPADIGQPKSSCAATHLKKTNPEISIVSYNEILNEKNALSLFANYDIIIDGSDNLPTKFLINDAAVKTGKPVVAGAIEGFEGRVAVFNLPGHACYRCLHPQLPSIPLRNCAEAGIIGAVAGIAGTMMAMEAIKLATPHPSFSPLAGQLWMFDARIMETRLLTVPKKADCPACAHPDRIILSPLTLESCAVTVPDITDINELKNAVIFDVREDHEWAAGHIPQARHLPLSALRENPSLFQPPGDAPCILYCQRGMRSKQAADILAQAGFKNLYNLTGGYEAWRQRA